MKRNIGRIDKADFPLLNLFDIEVKIDTGAYTSSIHCKNVKIEDNFLKCNFLDEEHPSYHEKEIIFDEYDVKVVRSSNGQSAARYRIKTEITLFGKTQPIYLTLSDREEMRFPVLLGRKFLSKKYMVDINKTNLSFKLKTKNEH
ncbi:ATP-dependent zinc protease family protein [Aequorivita echinoideorum]|uniref:RimK/LysX family protein n=1 Tax=Aequorivita echinoideorum TaxID=1549647 RepID=A0ABS5S185_9FLAO|nr:RimK/LysX family protein [Aequorivita echinoideorum]MBT0606983.1 RimK/LysX family protein [Aequorivita echinoideorum]